MNLFIEKNSSEVIVNKIQSGEWTFIMNHLCHIKDNSIILDNHYFKFFATKETYNIILTHIFNNLDTIITNYDTFVVHINMKGLTVSDIDKHLNFIQTVSSLFKEKYPNKLTKCFIHNAPFVFSKLLKILSLIIDKETRDKIEVVSKNNALEFY